MSLTLSTLSLEYVLVPVSATVAGRHVDISADTVAMAFPVADALPLTGDWKTASWETVGSRPTSYLARCLVGPGGTVTLTAGTFDIWVRVADSPEVPARKVDRLVVT